MCLLVDRLFDDKRIAVGLLMVWLVVVLLVFKDIGMLETRFMTMGPSAATVFMGVTLDTWYKWNLVAVFTLINTSINDFMSDALSPWILNTITDHKTKYIPYSKGVCLLISQLWSVYCNVMSVFGLFLAMTQVDFVLIRMGADLTVNMYTNLKFMRNKVTCQERYTHHHDIEVGGHELSSFCSDTGSDSPERRMLSGDAAPASCYAPPAHSKDPPPQPIFCIEEEPYPQEAEGGKGLVRAHGSKKGHLGV